MSGDLEKIKSAVMDVPGVSRVEGDASLGHTTFDQLMEQPGNRSKWIPHQAVALDIVVFGGDDKAVARAIFETIPKDWETMGKVSVKLSTKGRSHIHFSRITAKGGT